MRIAVTGRNGQLARSLLERAAPRGVEVALFGRPEVELTDPAQLDSALATIDPSAVINAAAYTQVDRAEDERELAHRANAELAGAVARAAAKRGVPVLQVSTDYVFDGALDRAYREDDTPHPVSVYGATKLEGERAVAAANPDHAIVRTSWVYSPFGKNFVRTMLTLAQNRDEITVVSDQHGAPTNALDLADGLIQVAQALVARPEAAELRGVFHMTGGGETNWAEFAQHIFAASAAVGGPTATVRAIPSSDFPTPARRPANSRLDHAKLRRLHAISLPDWRSSLPACVARLVAEQLRGDRPL